MYVHLHTLTQVRHSPLTASKDWMNDLQHLPEKDHGPVLVTLNPPFEPQSDLIAGKYKYEHPVLDSAVRSNSKSGTVCLFSSLPSMSS